MRRGLRFSVVSAIVVGSSLPARFDAAENKGSAPVAAFVVLPSRPAAGSIVRFGDSSSGSPTSWSWRFGDDATSAFQNPIHTYSAPGRYIVELTVSSSVGSSSVKKVLEVVAAKSGKSRARVVPFRTPISAPAVTPRSSEDERLSGNADDPSSTSAAPHRLFDAPTTALFLGMAFVVTPVAGYLEWWHRDEWQRFHWAHEGFFGRNTYAGGADKASHFYYGTLGEEALSAAYARLGHPPAEARALALANSALCAVMVEVGDGLTSYGFSWEDATLSTAGALVDAAVLAKGWQDSVGFRYGPFPLRVPPGETAQTPPHRSPGAGGLAPITSPLAAQAVIGTGYSYEIYTVDLKLRGLPPRFGSRPGVARYFLLSATYRTHGYTELLDRAQTQRLLGIEVGLSFPEVLRVLGVKESTWWGESLIQFFEHFRVPYSAVGLRYDLNGRRWRGFGFGDKP